MLCISASLEVVTVLRKIIQGARSFWGARYGEDARGSGCAGTARKVSALRSELRSMAMRQ